MRLPPGLRLTPEQFELVCAENREAVLEWAADGRVMAITPTGSETSGRNSDLLFQLQRFAKPLAEALTADIRRGFAPLGIDLVVELASPPDEGPRGLTALRSKMPAYQANGARLGWLLIPQQQAVKLWSASGAPQRLEQIQVLEATPEFGGLQLQVAEIWAG